MKIQYLEFVTPDVDALCATQSRLLGVTFSEPVAALGNARTAALADGGRVGVRAPMSEAEEPAVRTYWLVSDIAKAVEDVAATGAEVIHPPLELPGQGTFAIYQQGGIQQGLWQD